MNIHNFLKERGYQGPVVDTYKDCCVYFYRRIPDTDHQWVVREYDFSKLTGVKFDNYSHSHSYELEMVYETFDGTWVKNSFYGISEEELANKLGALEQRIYAAVEPMGGDDKDYRGEKD